MAAQADGVDLLRSSVTGSGIALHRRILPPDRITVAAAATNVVRVIVRGIEYRGVSGMGQQDQDKANDAFFHGSSLCCVSVSSLGLFVGHL